MDFDPLDRRGFLAVGGASLLCTLAGHEIVAGGKKVDVEGLAREVQVPPKVAAAEAEERRPGG